MKAVLIEAEGERAIGAGGGMSADVAPALSPGAGIMLVNRDGKVFVGQRMDSTLEAWQMPQGGIDAGEDALAAALRELGEETGIAADKVELIATAPEELLYDLPAELDRQAVEGQIARPAPDAGSCSASSATIRTSTSRTEHQEFRAWRWADPADLPAMIVPFKKALYEQVLDHFSEHIQ